MAEPIKLKREGTIVEFHYHKKLMTVELSEGELVLTKFSSKMISNKPKLNINDSILVLLNPFDKRALFHQDTWGKDKFHNLSPLNVLSSPTTI